MCRDDDKCASVSGANMVPDGSVRSSECSVEGSSHSSDAPYPPEALAQLHECDVICGQGRSHMGNLYFRSLVLSRRTDYQKAARADKGQYIQEIIAEVQSNGGRFVKWEDDQWNQVDDAFVRDKVAHALRSSKPAAPRQRRTTPVQPPTNEEDRLFAELLRKQREYLVSAETIRHQEEVVDSSEHLVTSDEEDL